ncbi:MAG TPA: hypothetical protein VGP27_00190 [Mycobacterium sp.]|nr:hypothetical protein [Mycobacterium sp.]
MAQVIGFDPAASGQQPEDVDGNPVPVGVWGDSDTGGGVFGSSGALPSGASIPIDPPAGVEGHGAAGPGVVGRSLTGNGVVGESQDGTGVLARSVASYGLLGVTFAPDDSSHGVFGSSTTGGNGVTGFVGDADGVVGSSIRGAGVRGTTGNGQAGVVGENYSDGSDGGFSPGVYGHSDHTVGVYGSSNVHYAIGGHTYGDTYAAYAYGGGGKPSGGVLGFTYWGTGVHGQSQGAGAGPGVFGETLGNGAEAGVYGSSNANVGVRGVSIDNNGTAGLTTGGASGVSGVQFSTTPGAGVSGISVLGNGVEGLTFANKRQNPDAAAVRGQSSNGFAGLFVGPVRVTGNLSKTGGGFTIDHPNDPENQYLSHSFVESPDMLNVYSGTVTTNREGTARVRLPAYFETLNSDFRYQLTVIGDFAQAVIAEEVSDGALTIRTDRGRVKVSWQVTGVRQDAWAQANRIQAEQKKPRQERGKYLHPELFGAKAVGLHPAPPVRWAEVVPEQLREWADGLADDLDRAGAGLARSLDKARRLLRDRADASRVQFEERGGRRAEAARNRLRERSSSGLAGLEEQWRDVERMVEGMRPKR